MAEVEIKSIIVNAATQFFSKFGFSKTTMYEITQTYSQSEGLLLLF